MFVPAHQFKGRTPVRLIAIIVVCIVMFGALTPSGAASWPQRAGPAAWPTARSGAFQYHVQPPTNGVEMPSAAAFRTAIRISASRTTTSRRCGS